MNCPLFDVEEVRVLLAAASKIPPPPAGWVPPAAVGLLWTRFSREVRRPKTSVHADEFHFERHWEWEGGGRSEGRLFITSQGARMEAFRLVWQHAHGPVPAGQFPRPACGWKECVAPHHLRLRPRICHGQKLSNRQRREAVVAARDAGASEALAAQFGVSIRTIKRLLDAASGSTALKELWP